MSLLFLRRAKPLFVSCCSATHSRSSFLSPTLTNQLVRSFHGSRTMSESEKKILTEEELERKKKKEEKAKEKELKKQKALEKERLAELKAKQAKDGTNVPKKSAKKSSKRDASEENPEDFVDPETPLGERKRLSSQMAKQYSPATVEKSWYAWWEKSDLFKADAKSSKPPFVIVLPPPNVTGALHIGHALTSAIEDTIIRWKRMSGYNALWVPGVDHAGIATQVVVEKKIMRDRGMTRHDVGREEFVKEVWKWKNQYGGTILTQLRRLGASLDWSRECFTMDEQRSKAVTEAFVRLYKEGLIYRDIRLVNWDCILRTAISDVEVEYIDIKEKTLLKVPGYEKPVEFGLLTSFAYPLEGGLGEVIVATTRVETMLGDTAIAIHPDDARYKHLHGKFAVHPFNGRKLPIICDGILVDPNFGTGCVKITPAHDPNDCEVGKRHKLEFINIFTDDGKINTNGGSDFAGMPRFAAREAVVEALQKQGLYRGAKNNEMRLGLCSRTNDVIEPMIKPQWYVNCSMIGKEALDVAITDENKKLEFVPKQYTAEWRRWLENIRDWCISRQLWWGHRIPAWYATLEEDQLKEVGAYSDHWVVARTEDDAREEAAQKFLGKKFELTRDPDVLDTWFSSGLFPLSVLGWPDVTDDFKAFYPTSVLETGHDILFFWVARMVMMGMKLGGEVPFSKVYFHPMIRDAHGRKMSKSLGNVIDPLEVINGVTLEGLHKRLEEGNLDPKEVIVAKEGQVKDFPNGIPECGTDALRFALVSYTAQSDKINLDILRVVGYRQWCNKLWNAVRFAMMKLGDGYTPPQTLSPETMPFSCQWILSVLNKAISKTVVSLDAFEFSDAANTIYAWWQYQFCDVYIEAIKPYFAGDNPTFASERAHAQHALWISLETGLRLLHPFMPFVTEELWQRLPAPKDTERKASIMICDYPSAIENWSNEKVESEMDTVLATVKCMRALRAGLLEKQKNERLPAFALCENNVTSEIVKSHELEIRTLANLSSLEVVSKGQHAAPPGSSVETVNENLKVYLEVDGAINTEAEQEKIRNKIGELQKQKEKLQKMMSVSTYEEKVPANIKEDNANKLAKILQEFDFFEKESARLAAETSNSGNQ
ncbi:valyl-tRNA synthetase / valine-tRNA ligase (VALRS) [Arabidopsis thaliana]|uniref:Valine--tRNA ligase, mitochondrial 1 n=1 Tax=Arabidopsis thaliana TaxID=3702 RepID=SYVM1_ARATH|nr:valyl-tRNA synthetase / valine-tRNA ligase (VALRS) [Arabidopsis thaliana]P93736.2 RecName: Full=Valine--tRNA ligase, mitochondrial 1; AltName: Full=AtSYV1; AltName: Full=Protein TWIN 2; AltName: Full=Valyl-tRNA synthetase; Short=ValRS; Flags: Precursor [Arabidopsis thaliana]AEE29190.1 valyl-tRNA synthetase / valine-tRNA ligase (VALRS) [Arabidopsis thaliana]|eukprot:NP_172913.1 valyl-tRNA synthetase / valine-tRNA ligase (VALRS) [Arabidopsis thaliana]